MDAKIRNIEWCAFHPPPRHTVFKGTHDILLISGKTKQHNISHKHSWPFDRNWIAPLNEPCKKAVDFVRKYGISRSSFFHIGILVRYRGPPLLCFGKQRIPKHRRDKTCIIILSRAMTLHKINLLHIWRRQYIIRDAAIFIGRQSISKWRFCC